MAKINSKIQKSKSGEAITVRHATIADAEKMHALGVSVFKTTDYLVATAEEFSAISKEQQNARIKRLEDSDNDLWLIAECGDQLVGMLDFQSSKTTKTRHKGSFGMIVSPSWQGKGVGSLLLITLIDWVRSHPQINVINLTVSEENKPAIALYRKLGFQATGREPFGLKLPNGQYLVDLTMTLKL